MPATKSVRSSSISRTWLGSRREEVAGQRLKHLEAVGLDRRLVEVLGHAQQVASAAVGELDPEVAVDQQHALVEAVEQALQPVAILLERLEELFELPRIRSIDHARLPTSSGKRS